MVHIVEGNKKLNHDISECDSLISNAKSISDKALMHFFDLINLDKSFFEHLIQIPIVIDLDDSNDYEDLIAFYDNINEDNHELDNSIHLLPEYIDSIFDSDNYNDMFLDLAGTLIHETIHANRTVIINSGIVYPQSFLSHEDEYREYSDKYFHLITDGFLKYCVLKYTIYNHSVVVYTYNRRTNDFVIFYIPKKFTTSIKNISDMELFINQRSNYSKFSSYIIENPYDVNNSALACDYSTSFTNITELNESNKRNVDGEIIKQRGFEECLTEAFTKIILYLRDKDDFNFDKLLDSNKVSLDVNLALYFIKSLDMDTIRWFFLSCYYEEYRNRFFELYQMDYYKLIDRFTEVYDCTMNGEKFENYNNVMKLIKALKKNNE